MYPDTKLLIDGKWRQGSAGDWIDVENPASGETIGRVASASIHDLEEAAEAAVSGFEAWRGRSPYERSAILRSAAQKIRASVDQASLLLTLEQGKPLAEARAEILASADVLDWCAEEGRRVYGRVVPGRSTNVQQVVSKEPVGPSVGFIPWNFPVVQTARKLGPAIAAGCSIIVKGPEETPASIAAFFQALVDAGVPSGVIGLVFGVPSMVSEFLIPHPAIRKVSFTGSVPVGKRLAALAGLHMKRTTMELGGHAPVLIFSDADVERAASILSSYKFRNAGQVCIAPTRFLVQEPVFEDFCARFISMAERINVGPGTDPETKMGPVVSQKRLSAIEELVSDAVDKGAGVSLGGKRIGNRGNFYAPTVLTDVSQEMRVMNEEPFGPLVLMQPHKDADSMIEEANRLPFGLASYAFTKSAERVQAVSSRIEAGMLSINHVGLALPEVHFGGVKDSGHGSEGGADAIEAYLVSKLVTLAT